ncbi:T9SS type A sorting domain-containing protein [Flavobacterium sp. JP2137]|uniref:Ig-like domain-containing protein n=1 Tax=Flavobacterium sp. JP2137 TaxID=3414510 RepID=UPI003D2FD8B3
MKRITFLFLLSFSLCCSAQEYVRLGISTGFNADVIANGTGPAIASTTHRVDEDQFDFLSLDFKESDSAPAATVGLPIDGVINAAFLPTLNFQLQSYSQNNSLRIGAVGESGELIFAIPQQLTKLYFLVTGGSAGSSPINFDVTVHFSDSTTETFTLLSVLDWYGGSPSTAAISGIGRVHVGTNDIETPAGNPKMFGEEINLNSANYYKNATKVVITKTSSNGVLNVFAVSGIRTPRCFMPGAATVSDITAHTAMLHWGAAELAPETGYSYEVRSSGLPGSGANGLGAAGLVTQNILAAAVSDLQEATVYTVYVKSGCAAAGYSDWTDGYQFRTACLFPEATITATALCGVGRVTMTANVTGANVRWFDSALGGEPLGDSLVFVTPRLSETTSFWFSKLLPNASLEKTGKLAVGATPLSNSGYVASGVVFDVAETVYLESVDVYSGTDGLLEIALVNDQGIEFFTTGMQPIVGHDNLVPNVVGLGVEVPPGNAYRMLIKNASNLNLLYENDNLNFPYADENQGVKITASDYLSVTTSVYAYFYNITFFRGCVSPREEIEVSVDNSAPSLTLSQVQNDLCAGQLSENITLLAGATDYSTFVWEPSEGVSGNAQDGWVFNPSHSQVYTLTASQSNGLQCTMVKEVAINRKSELVPQYAPVYNPVVLCQSTIVPLSVDFISDRSIQVGSSVSQDFNNNLSAFNNYRHSARVQMLFTATEIRALGMVDGPINSIAFYVSSLGASPTNDDYTVRIAHSDLSSYIHKNYVEDGFVTVFSPQTYTHTDSGWQTITFDTLFEWDGISNIVIEIEHTGIDDYSSAKTHYTATDDYKVIYGYNGNTTYLSRNRFNIKLQQIIPQQVTWESQASGLYIDEAATISYVQNTHAPSVYYQPAHSGVSAVTATLTVGTCSTTHTFDIHNSSNGAPLPGVESEVLLCDGSTLENITVQGQNLKWFDTQNNGQPLDISTVLQSGVYYVNQTVDGCESALKSVQVNIVARPSAPTNTTNLFCGEVEVRTGDMHVEYEPGNTLNWYDLLGNPISADYVLTSGSGYWVSQSNAACESDLVLAVLYVYSTPDAPEIEAQQYCGAVTVAQSRDVIAQGALRYFVQEQGGTALEDDAVLTTRTYYISKVVENCESQRAAVEFVVDEIPQAPTGAANQEFSVESESTIAALVTAEENVVWFATEEDARANKNSLPSTALLASETVYYGVLISDLGCVSEPFAVKVTLILGVNGFDLDELAYYPNPVKEILKISYRQTLVKVEVYALSGKRLLVQECTDHTVEIAMGDLPAATYIIKLYTANQSQAIRVIKN